MSEHFPGNGGAAEQGAKEFRALDKNKHVVTVLGSGRSGTSLLMQVLCELGMSVSGGSMVQASGANPEGFFEDSEIVDIHKSLLNKLDATAISPLPLNWHKRAAALNAQKHLTQIIQKRLRQAEGEVWGFKDPRTNNFMSLWVRLFNQPGLNPRYILAVRDPSAVLGSLREHGSPNDSFSELVWLRRNVEALHYTAGNCFIVHYEDWFERPEEVVRGLLAYTGLDKTFQGDEGEVVKRVVKGHLNRAPRQHQDIEIKNPCVTELYEALNKCRGDDFDHVSLMNSVERTRRIMSGFDIIVRNSAGQSKKSTPSDENTNKEELVALTNENNQLLRELTEATKEVESLRTNLYAKPHTKSESVTRPTVSSPITKSRQNQQVQRLKREIKSIRQSYTFKIGWVLVNAIKKPGMNTLKAPFRLGKLFLKYARSKKR
ncbi:sulfotransferase family protein [Chromohalobacter israelensis]|uniref:sulfotransferase family protein n=1 Tax=Chromohalobacter israelensis TaxID=141390 RepID=UPI00265C3F1A|nr:sulfotransferase [Chromohalobacter salexigens]MDO0946707.1 sulfotransferase [Chromohalobacter salexigens]